MASSSTGNNGNGTSSHHDPEEAEAAIQLFCELLKFRTVSFEGPGTGAYRACAQWLVETLGGRLGLETQVCEWIGGVWGQRGGIIILEVSIHHHVSCCTCSRRPAGGAA